MLRSHDVPKRTSHFDAQVRAGRLATCPHGPVAADERRGARAKALRPRDPTQRKRPTRIRKGRREPVAPRERAEQVRGRREVNVPEVDRRGGTRRERGAHRPHALEFPLDENACKVRARADQVVRVQIRERGHVRRETRARRAQLPRAVARGRPAVALGPTAAVGAINDLHGHLFRKGV